MDQHTASPLELLETADGYRRHFMNEGFWQPYLERVCRTHGLTCVSQRPGLAGTFPTFIVNEKWVIKFFGPQFNGEICWQVEQAAAQLLAGVPTVPAARLLASGSLFGETGWSYLVFEFILGVSIGEVYGEIPFDDKLALARWLGERLPPIHKVEIRDGSALPRLSERLARDWFSTRWPDDRSRWPTHLAEQVEPYLSDHAAFLQIGADCFIHADLTQDHFLGTLTERHWNTLAVIDFGDAMLGNIYYELAALHLDLFDCDKRLLDAFLRAYNFPPDPDFMHKAMVTSLLHQFDVYGHLFSWKPELLEVRMLEELAERLWKINN